ncbi:MAG TPA: hypothetical protein VHB51_02755 [Candidatus Saccharimonadales bacterium]|nr:hypothetical protein [Candidatus Saccharimonadales bacterium]
MAMTLTKDDLKAIGSVIDERLDEFKLQVAAAFEEVHRRIDKLESRIHGLETKVEAIDKKLDRESQRNDNQDLGLAKIRQALHSA